MVGSVLARITWLTPAANEMVSKMPAPQPPVITPLPLKVQPLS